MPIQLFSDYFSVGWMNLVIILVLFLSKIHWRQNKIWPLKKKKAWILKFSQSSHVCSHILNHWDIKVSPWERESCPVPVKSGKASLMRGSALHSGGVHPCPATCHCILISCNYAESELPPCLIRLSTAFLMKGRSWSHWGQGYEVW